MAEPVVIRFGSEVAAAIRGIREVVTGINQTGEAAKAASASMVASAREQVEAQVKQRAEIRATMEAYKLLASEAKRGSEQQIVANRLAADSARQLGLAYKEAGVAASRAAKASSRGAEESGVLRGFASRTTGVTAFAGGAFIAGAIGGALIKKAADEAQRAQESQTQLARAMQVVGESYGAQRKQIERYLEVREKVSNFDRVDLRTNLTSLVRATGDVTKAQALLNTAQEVARGRHIDLASATMLTIRAEQGNIGMLRRVGIDVQKVTTAEDALRAAHIKTNPELVKRAKLLDQQATATRAVTLLNERYAGSAEAHAKTLAGREEALGNAIREMAVQIGTAATPALMKLVTWMTKEIDAAMHSERLHRDLHEAFKIVKEIVLDLVAGLKPLVEHWRLFVPLILGAVVAFKAVRIAMALAKGETIELTAVMDAMPWMAIATAAVIAVGLIIRHWSTVKKWMGELWDYIERTGNAAWAAVVQTAKLAVYVILEEATAAIRGILEVASHLPFVGKKARSALNSINDYLQTWKPDFSKVVTAFGQGGSAAGTAFASRAAAAMAGASGATATGGVGAAAGSSPNRAGYTGATENIVSGGNALQKGLVGTAQSALGNPYHYGGAPSLASPTDCSGLMVAVFAQHGISLPRTSQEQYASAPIKNVRPLAPGDLVFAEGIHPGHVGLYIGNGQVLEDPHTGDHVKIVPLSGFGWNGESARWWAGRARSTGGGGAPVASTAAAAVDTTAAFDAALAGAPKKAAAGPKGLSSAALITIQAGVDRTLGKLPAHLDKIEKDAVSHLRSLRASLHTGMSAEDVAKTRASITHWGGVLKGEIKKQTTAAHKQAADAARAAAAAFAVQWSYATTQIKKQFDLATAAHLRDMQKGFAAQMTQFDAETKTKLTAMQRAFADQMTAYDRETQIGLQKYVVDQTPEEKALADFQKARQDAADQLAAQQRQADLATAIAGGDPQQIAQAQDAINQAALDEQEKGLKEAADKSRQAQDDATKQAQDAYQQQRDDHKTFLQNKEQDAEDAYNTARDALKTSLQDQENAAEQAYQDLRDMQSSYLDADLNQWQTWIKNKSKTYQQFLDWLASVGFGNPGTPPPDPFANTTSVTSTAIRRTGRMIAMAAGGFVPGPAYVNRDSVPILGMPGEYMMSRREVAQGAPDWSSGATHIHVYNPTFLGGTERQVARALERMVGPELNRRVGFTKV